MKRCPARTNACTRATTPSASERRSCYSSASSQVPHCVRIEAVGSASGHIFTYLSWEGGNEERGKGRGGYGGPGLRAHSTRRSITAPARLHRRHLTRALRRPRRSEPGGPGCRSGSSGLLRPETHFFRRIHVYALIFHSASAVRVKHAQGGLYFGSCASTRSFRRWHGN